MREKIITRTVITLEVNVMGIDSDNNVAVKVIPLPLMDEKKILSYLMNHPMADFTPAKILKVEQVEQLYGMPESLFMQYATKLPPRKDYSQKGED